MTRRVSKSEMRRGSFDNKLTLFNKVAADHEESQMCNPFSEWEGASTRKRLSKGDVGYGRPVSGSKTEKRGIEAQERINREMRELCDIIQQYGRKNHQAQIIITFGELFMIYTVISSKCVGLLISARRHGFLTFEGETLFQRKDDNVIVTLSKPIEEIRKLLPNAAEKYEAMKAERQKGEHDTIDELLQT